MGIQHARSSAQLGHKVAVVCDVDLVRATALGSVYPDCAEVLTDPAQIRWHEIDAAFICVPPFARGEVELAAARAGVAVFLEKPIGLSAAQLLPALQAARTGAVITSVGYMNRYRASVVKAREILQGETILGLSAHWVGAAYRVAWWGNPELSGGQLNEQCTHLIDLARYLVGEVAEVNAFAQPGPEGSGGTAAVSTVLRFRNGTLGTIFCGSMAKEKQIGLRVFTPRGQLVLEGWDFKWQNSPVFGEGGDPSEDVFLSECGAFLTAVRTGDTAAIRCDLADAMKTQRVVDAARAALAGSGAQAIAAEIAGGETIHALDFA
jgi:myo-inositol 2-dehydrogenase/D-chiro-inositol 1-dehydrogenase